MIGVISYSLYLWQQLFLSPTGWLATAHVIGPLLGAFAAATLSYFCVERPLLRLAGPSRPTTPCLTTP
jgi:peptidoglycan/LPS O-acetylase OafA/YrhL